MNRVRAFSVSRLVMLGIIFAASLVLGFGLGSWMRDLGPKVPPMQPDRGELSPAKPQELA